MSNNGSRSTAISPWWFRVPAVIGGLFFVTSILIAGNFSFGAEVPPHEYFNKNFGVPASAPSDDTTSKIDGWQRFVLWFAFASIMFFIMAFFVKAGSPSAFLTDFKDIVTNGLFMMILSLALMGLGFGMFYRGLPATECNEANQLVHEEDMGVGMGLMIGASALMLGLIIKRAFFPDNNLPAFQGFKRKTLTANERNAAAKAKIAKRLERDMLREAKTPGFFSSKAFPFLPKPKAEGSAEKAATAKMQALKARGNARKAAANAAAKLLEKPKAVIPNTYVPLN